MNGVMIFTVVFTILLIWLLLASYHYAYKRKWGNENAAVDALPDKETDGTEEGKGKPSGTRS